MDAVQRRGSAERMNYIKRFGCLLLTFVFCFSLMPAPRARASVVAGTAVTAGLIVQIIAGAGATIQAADMANKVVEDFFAANPEVEALLLEKTKIVMDATTGAYHAVCDFTDDLWQSVCEWVDHTFDSGDNSRTSDFSIDSNITLETPITSLPVTIVHKGGDEITVFSFVSNNMINYTTKSKSGTLIRSASVAGDNIRVSSDIYGTYIYFFTGDTANSSTSLTNVISITGVVFKSVPVVGADNYIDNYGREWVNEQSRSVSVPLYPSASSDGIKIGTDYYDGYLPETYGWISGEAYVDGYGVAHDATEAKTYQDVAAKEVVKGLPLVDDGGTLTIPKADSAYDVGDITIGEIDAATKDGALSALLITKFPFSIPWDVYNAIKLLAAPAMVPHWEVDFMAPIAHRVGGWQGDTTIVIDFSEYELLGQLSRWLTTIMFMAALAMGTKKIMWTA